MACLNHQKPMKWLIVIIDKYPQFALGLAWSQSDYGAKGRWQGK